jgi:hypothetical protein
VVYVRCDELQIVEEPIGSCPLQIKILKRYGETIQLGEIRKWEDRRTPSVTPRPRGGSVFQATYRLSGSSSKRGIYIYAPTEGNPLYTLATLADNKETGALYGDRVEISKKFALLQVEWLAEGCQYDGGGGGGSTEKLFLFTH